jgi:hypothetical protein
VATTPESPYGLPVALEAEYFLLLSQIQERSSHRAFGPHMLYIEACLPTVGYDVQRYGYRDMRLRTEYFRMTEAGSEDYAVPKCQHDSSSFPMTLRRADR